MQPAGRVYEQCVVTVFGRVLLSTADERHRIIGLFCLVNRDANSVTDHLELCAGSGPIHVYGNEQRLSLLIIRKPARDLTGRCSLTRTLQSDDHDRIRYLLGKYEPR